MKLNEWQWKLCVCFKWVGVKAYFEIMLIHIKFTENLRGLDQSQYLTNA